MARIGGRSGWIAWPAGLACLAVVAALVWLALPMMPVAVQWAGDALRGPTSRPAAEATPPAGSADQPLGTGRGHAAASPSASPTPSPDAASCRSLYTAAQWAELTVRTGGDPAEDTSAPALAAPTVVTALHPTVRMTCTWAATTTGRITTTVADVDAEAGAIARAALAAQGFACGGFGDGMRCTRTDGAVVEDVVVRDGVWLSSVLDNWRPTLYTERIADQLWR